MVLPLIAALSFGVAAGGLVYRAVIRHGGVRKAAAHVGYRSGILRPPVRTQPNFANPQDSNDQLLRAFEENPYFTGGFEEVMTLTEAELVLGISEEDAKDPKKIQLAHRKVIVLNHPDYGGSAYLASKINEAKDLLEEQVAVRGHKKE